MWGTARWSDLVPDTDVAMHLFAVYGLAVFESAGLEESIVLLLAIQAMEAGVDRGSEEMRELLTSRRQRTLGRLLGEAGREGLLPGEVVDRFTDALAERNWLIHHFQRELIPEIVDPGRIDALLARLDNMRKRFVETGAMANSLMDERLSQQGTDLHSLEDQAWALVRQLQQEWEGA